MEDDELKEFAMSDRQFRIVLPLEDDFDMEDDIDMRCPIALFTAETCPLGFMFSDANADYPCEDIDECTTSLNVCRAGEQCLNQMGGLKCLPPEPEPIFPTSQPDGQCRQQIISEHSVQAAFAVAIADTALTAVVPALSAWRCPAGTRADRPSLLHVINRLSLSSPWTLEQTLHLGEQVDSDRSCDVEHVLGVSLSFSSDGQSLLSGTQERPAGDGSNEKAPGVAVIFDRVDNGLPYDSRQTLIPSTASNFGDGYGSVVCLSADGLTAAVGAPRGGNNSGRLVIFSRSEQGGEFTQLQDLGKELVDTKIDVFKQSLFGNECSLSAEGLKLVVGAPRLQTEVSSGAGMAVVLQRQSGSSLFDTSNIQYLSPPSLISADSTQIGGSGLISVDMDAAGATIVVGRSGVRNGLFGGFAIYQAFLNEWIQVTGGPIYGRDNAQGLGDFAEQYPLKDAGFGSRVRINAAGTMVYVSAPGQAHPGSIANTGSVFVYERSAGRSWSFAEEVRPEMVEAPYESSALAITDGQGFGQSLDVAGESGLLIMGCNFCREAFIFDASCRCGLRELQAGLGGACDSNFTTSCDPIRTYGVSPQWSPESARDLFIEVFDQSGLFPVMHASADGRLVAIGLDGQNAGLLPQVGLIVFFKRGENDILEPGGVLNPPSEYAISQGQFGNSLKLSGDGEVLVVMQTEVSTIKVRYIHFFYRYHLDETCIQFQHANTVELAQNKLINNGNPKKIALSKDGSRVFIGDQEWSDPKDVSGGSKSEGRVMIFTRRSVDDVYQWELDDEIKGIRGRVTGSNGYTPRDPDYMGGALAVNAAGTRIVVYCESWADQYSFILMFDDDPDTMMWESRFPDESKFPFFRVPNERDMEPGYTASTQSLLRKVGSYLAMSDDGMTFAAVAQFGVSPSSPFSALIVWEQTSDNNPNRWFGQMTGTINTIGEKDDIKALSLSGNGKTAAVAFDTNVIVVRRSGLTSVRWRASLIGPFDFLPPDDSLRRAEYGRTVSLVGDGQRVLFLSNRGGILNEIDTKCACGADSDCECLRSGGQISNDLSCNCTELAATEIAGVCVDCVAQCAWDPSTGEGLANEPDRCGLAKEAPIETPVSDSSIQCFCEHPYVQDEKNGVCKRCGDHCTTERNFFIRDAIVVDCDVEVLGVRRNVLGCFCNETVAILDPSSGLCLDCYETCAYRKTDRKGVDSCGAPVELGASAKPICICDTSQGFTYDEAAGLCVNCAESCSISTSDYSGVLGCDVFLDAVTLDRSIECECGNDAETGQTLQRDVATGMCVNCEKYCLRDGSVNPQALDSCHIVGDYPSFEVGCMCSGEVGTSDGSGLCLDCESECAFSRSDREGVLGCILDTSSQFPVKCQCDTSKGYTIDPATGRCVLCRLACTPSYLPEEDRHLACSSVKDIFEEDRVLCECKPEFEVPGGAGSTGACYDCGEFSLSGDPSDVKSCNISGCNGGIDLSCAMWACADDAEIDVTTGLCFNQEDCVERCGPAPDSNKNSTLASCYARTRADSLKIDTNSRKDGTFGWTLGCLCLPEADKAMQNLEMVIGDGPFVGRLQNIGEVAYHPERRCFEGDPSDVESVTEDYGCDSSFEVAVRRASHLGSGDNEYLCIGKEDDKALCSFHFDGKGVLIASTMFNKTGSDFLLASGLFGLFGNDVLFDCIQGFKNDPLDPFEYPECRLCLCSPGYESRFIGGRRVCVRENYCGSMCTATASSERANKLWQTNPSLVINIETKEFRPDKTCPSQKPLTQVANTQTQGPQVNNMWVKSSRFTTTSWGGLGWTSPPPGITGLIDFWEADPDGVSPDRGITLQFNTVTNRDAVLKDTSLCFEMVTSDDDKPSFSFPLSEAFNTMSGSLPSIRWLPVEGGVLTSEMLDIATDMGYLYPNGVYTFVICDVCAAYTATNSPKPTSQLDLTYPSLSAMSWLDPLFNAPYDFGDYVEPKSEPNPNRRRGMAYLRLSTTATIDEDDPVEIKMAPFLSIFDVKRFHNDYYGDPLQIFKDEYIRNPWLLPDACPTFCTNVYTNDDPMYTACPSSRGITLHGVSVFRTFSIPGTEICNSTFDVIDAYDIGYRDGRGFFIGSAEEHEYYVKFVSDPAGYSCGEQNPCYDNLTLAQRQATACEEDPASKYPWLEDIDRDALRQGCIGEFGDRLFVAGPGTSYSEYPARELTGKSVFAGGSFCGQNETEPVANTILLDDKTNFAPSPAESCPCMDDSKYNNVFKLLVKGNATVATVTSFRPATSYFDDHEKSIGFTGVPLKRWHELDALPFPFYTTARIGTDGQRCVDCEADCSMAGDGKGVLACAPRSDVQLSPGGAALVQCYCAPGYQVDKTSGRCVNCVEICTLDGNGLITSDSCSLTPPDAEGTSGPRCHCAPGYINEPRTGICVSVAQVELLTNLSNCQNVCLHSEFVDPNGVLGCGVGIIEDSILDVIVCICDEQNGYRLDEETLRCNSPFTVGRAIELFRAAAESGFDPFEPARKADEFQNNPIAFLAAEAASQGLTLESLLPFSLDPSDQRRLEKLKQFVPDSLFEQYNSSSLADYMARVREADAKNLFKKFSSPREGYSEANNAARDLLQSYDKDITMSGPRPLHRGLTISFVPPIVFDNACFQECGMLENSSIGLITGVFGCLQYRSNEEIKRSCLCIPGFSPEKVLDQPLDFAASIFASAYLSLDGFGKGRCTPCVGSINDYVNGAPLTKLVSSTQGCGRGKPWQWYKTTCFRVRLSVEGLGFSFVTNCGCSSLGEYYEYNGKANRRGAQRLLSAGGCLGCKEQCSWDNSGDGVFSCGLEILNKLEISLKPWRNDIPRKFSCQCLKGYAVVNGKCKPAQCPFDFSGIIDSVKNGGQLLSCSFFKESVRSSDDIPIPFSVLRFAPRFWKNLFFTLARRFRYNDGMSLYLRFKSEANCGMGSETSTSHTLRLELTKGINSAIATIRYPVFPPTVGCSDFAESQGVLEELDVENRRACLRDLERGVRELGCGKR